ncbi:hypothetical protein D8B46_09285 [Candidatus Gracilibacteria bacterium]|nr:MAG: hypothetical protein D8B46_09285 [Candidatus Gracilibacteria bacterium]
MHYFQIHNKMKKKILLFLAFGLSIFFSVENTFSAGSYCDKSDPFCIEQKTNQEFKVGVLDELTVNGIVYLMGFLYLVSIVYGLYGAWHILTAGGDDEKVKKGKTIIIRAVIGIVVIFSAYTIVNFVLGNDGFLQSTNK